MKKDEEDQEKLCQTILGTILTKNNLHGVFASFDRYIDSSI